ncbi:phosphonate metabolism protein/1,5-bisphosphokinase (PRPP-forming) PhnN [Labrenzia sp. OB1]|uniref:phosphonate metabolism protein/1,5-bisphosphokinase (PRPP-forming) PhnN n=1 Tax=Labrenzia sp. OB1 TaxID=1561204 RepID=UPI0007B19DEC|nr:phosphonate metabolism protein/1,5-bisphosphokinase (PRPP-forming) PhnN [Labrenzia sp. OB1]KZM51057.1 guanylate kinase [Labrenzia sp. OB1]
MPDAAVKLGPGRMVLVVGPSGAGKDTLMAALKDRLRGRSDVQFARRAITRQADTDAEDHDTLDRDGFEHLVAAGEMALAWEAHGLGYVIPKACDEIVRSGGTVIANGSRQVLKQAEQKYENAVVLLITAPVEILADRLAARGRETRAEIRARLERADLEPENVANLIRIENTGTIEDAVEKMMAALEVPTSH